MTEHGKPTKISFVYSNPTDRTPSRRLTRTRSLARQAPRPDSLQTSKSAKEDAARPGVPAAGPLLRRLPAPAPPPQGGPPCRRYRRARHRGVVIAFAEVIEDA